MAEGMAKGIEKGRAVGHDEGFTEGMIKNVITIMRKTNQTADQVMDLLDIDKSLRPQIIRFIKQQNQ